jgi:hypothetical protein
MLQLFLLPLLLLVASGLLPAQSRNLDIYWIDVEGGAATLIVTPSGESLLIDTGWAVDDRDAKRIYAATRQAGLKKIDYLLISHFHADHVGGLAALTKMIPVGRFFDHGDDIEKENQQWLDSYKTASAGKRTVVNPGDKIPLKGLQTFVVSSNQRILSRPVNGGGPNPLCAGAEQKAPVAPREPAHRGGAAHVRQVQIPRPDRSRLGKGNGACLSGKQAGHGKRISDQPPRLARWRRSARISGSDQAAGDRSE